MDIALITCSKQKLPVPAPGKWMWSRSPRFSILYRVARRRANIVFILTAKYGIIHPEQIVDVYDLTLDDLNDQQLTAWKNKVYGVLERVPYEKCYMFLSKSHRKILADLPRSETVSEMTVAGGITKQSKAFGKQPGSLINKQNWPNKWLLDLIARSQGPPITIEQVRAELEAREYPLTSLYDQTRRVQTCPVLKVLEDGSIVPRYRPEDELCVDIPEGGEMPIVPFNLVEGVRNIPRASSGPEAYAAGVLDAEEVTVSVRAFPDDPDERFITVVCKMPSRRVADLFVDSFGGKISTEGIWRITGPKALEMVSKVKPYLINLKEPATLALEEMGGGEEEEVSNGGGQ